ncbi:S-ribosylhomocysteine lyase [Eremococcus coleocola]|uniref:S-ribosylhomocysteine lyase n=1 Tax=Eremococcus coleocola ACS-139-V-Col8 TaxID=908337 RepID=E4KP93_9LACT|nr:S-ribosylhomocysteine lyase [Eremococcus coleocola]EFR31380.1 S-ribosylhomocysteinase LuxS [Eremococcus coleocola ACS-139-V-Col8]
MEKIPSFTVDHLNLFPGLYLSRQDQLGPVTLNSYDLRFTRPNYEPVMNTAEIHTIEHLLATYLRNDPTYKDQVIYFGPMGCRTGFYLILTDKVSPEATLKLLKDAFAWASTYEGDIPGAAARDCGNYLDQNLPMARYYSQRYLQVLNEITDLSFAY